MIVTEKVTQTVTGTNINHYKNLGYNVKQMQKIDIPIEHLPKNSRCEIEAACFRCKKVSKMRLEHYNKCCSNQGYYACIKCCKEKTINTHRKKYGVDHASQSIQCKNKNKKTNLMRYGVENAMQNKKCIENMKQTNMIRYGVEFVSQLESVKQKKRETSIKNFGVDSHMKTPEGLRKNQVSGLHLKKYKNTPLYYQGTYELYFIELVDKIGLIHELKNGKQYTYYLDDVKHTYHTDFYFKNKNIEIKSSWTYNKNGKDKNLEFINHTKWESVKKIGNKINILIGKKAIKKYIDNINKNGI